MVPIPNFKKPKDMTKTYTTEEIITRLKTHETFVAIKMLLGDLIRYISIGNQYACRDVGLSTFTIIDDLKYKRQFDISEFNTYFMFTSDWEAMKSEERDAPRNTSKYQFPNLGSTTMIEKQEIPEWLQRERVRFWCEVAIAAAYLPPEAKTCYELADVSLQQFDKRFLNNSND